MPFGKYKDFNSCVLDNKDKSNPQAYCARIHKQITGKWPNEEGYKVNSKDKVGFLYSKVCKPEVYEESLKPTKVPKPGYEWVQDKNDNWYQRLIIKDKKQEPKREPEKKDEESKTALSPDKLTQEQVDRYGFCHKRALSWADKNNAKLMKTDEGNHYIAVKDDKVYDFVLGYDGDISLDDYQKKTNLHFNDVDKEEVRKLLIPNLDTLEMDDEKVSDIFNRVWKKYEGDLTKEQEKQRDEEFKKLRQDFSNPLNDELLSAKIPVKNVKFGKGDTGVVRAAQNNEGGHIEWMSPDEYLKLVNVKNNNDIKSFLNPKSVIKIVKGVKNGNELQPGFLDFDGKQIINHEGRHRAIAAKIMGIDKIPVAIIGNNHKQFDIKSVKPQDLKYQYQEKINLLFKRLSK